MFANAIMPGNFGGQCESAFFANPVGTGPFTLKSFVKGGNVSLVRNPHYWQAGKPYLDAVQFIYISDDNQRVLQLQSGQVARHRRGAAGPGERAEGGLLGGA